MMRGAFGNRASRFFCPEGRTYSPPERAVVLACGNRALCEADAAPAGAFGQCHPLLRVLSSSTQSAMCFASSSKQLFPFWKQLADCLHKPATGSFVAERVSQFTTPFSFSQKKQKSKNERTVRTNGNLSS